MSRLLQLNGREQFPVRRLAILWRNNRWRTFATKLCESKMGKELFNVSVFQKLSSYRIDDYILERIETSMASVLRIRDELHIELELNKDYQQLSSLKKSFLPRTLFYPKHRGAVAVNEKSPRLAGFLKHLDDHAYFSLCEYLVDHGRQFSFANPQEVLRSLNAHGKTMQLVMTHVMMWLNDEPTKVNHREGNKPPLVDDLFRNTTSVESESASTNAGRMAGARASLLNVIQNSPARVEESKARAKALDLQRDVLAYVEEHAASFTDPGNKEYLNSIPDDQMDPLVYRERFEHGPWRHLLLTVYRAVGPCFQNPCVIEFNDDTGEAIVDLSGPPSISLVDSIKRIVTQHPEIARDRLLNNPEAIEALRVAIEGAVSSWRSNQHGQDIFTRRPNRGMLAEAVARTDSAQRRRPSFPWTSHTGPVDRSNSDLARKLFPTKERAPLTDQQKSVFPWNRTNLSRSEAASSGKPTGAARVSVERVESYAPAISSPPFQSPRRHTREQSPVHEDEHSKSPIASKVKKTGQSATVQKRQQKGGWRTKPLARG
jgi:hypothetical protein